jgi:predicted MFS family arabinose efflux permease
MPLVVYALALGAFAMTTSEFMVSGMLPELTASLGVSLSAIGYLVSTYAVAMALGGPVLSAALARLPRFRTMVLLLAAFLVGQVLGAVATGYPMLAVSRVVTGCAEAAFFGVGLTVAVDAVRPGSAGRATSVVFGGLMLSTVLGMPLATVLAQWAGWRGAFWAVAVLVLVAGTAVPLAMHSYTAGRRHTAGRREAAGRRDAEGRGRAGGDGQLRPPIGVRDELANLRSRPLWAVYLTSMLHIGGLFAAYSYFAAIFIELTGVGPALVPAVLSAYGLAAVLGNMVVGRLADRYPMTVLTAGLAALLLLLASFAVGARHPAVALVSAVATGLVGLPLNSATVARRMRVAPNTPMINTLNASMVNVGIAVGPTLGGLAISAGLGLTAPLWIGAALAALALLSMAPYVLPARPTPPAGTGTMPARPTPACRPSVG